jgi:heptosyltransferase-2
VSSKSSELRNKRNILVRAVNWLGDAVMTTPAIGTIRECFPVAKITLLATPLVAEMFTPHPWVDEVLVYERKGRHKGLAGRLKLASELAGRNFDLAVLLPNSLDAALIAWLARIPCRLGYATDGRSLLLTHSAPLAARPLTAHQTVYYTSLLNCFGIGAAPKQQLLATTAAEDAALSALFSSAGIDGSGLIIGINPGATYGSAKRWYPDRFAAVADELARRWGAAIVVVGNPDEAAIGAEITGMMAERAVNLAGKTSVRELMAVIKRCSLFITNDSGPMHIAAAFGVPLVAVFGPTDSQTTYPLADTAIVVRQPVDCAPCMKRVCPTDHRCMTAVVAADVLAAAEQLKTAVLARKSH